MRIALPSAWRLLKWASPTAGVLLLLATSIGTYVVALSPVFPDASALTLEFPLQMPVDRSHLGLVEIRGVLWWVTAVLYVLTALVGIGVFSGVIGETVATCHSRRGWIATGLSALLATTVGVLMTLTPSPFRNFVLESLGKSLFRDTPVAHVLHFMDMLAATAMLLLIAAATACLVGPRERSSATVVDFEARASRLRSQSRNLRTVLFTGAAALVAGTVEVNALFGWVAVHLASPQGASAFEVTTSTATLTYGTWFSLYLTSVYLPAALLLRHDIAALARQALPEAREREQMEWLEERSLSTSIGTNLASIVALLGPILAGGPLSALGYALG